MLNTYDLRVKLSYVINGALVPFVYDVLDTHADGLQLHLSKILGSSRESNLGWEICNA